ncbi:MAG TPA: ribose-phosphate diphosphokinase [Conexivisphaerales archaeon]|nr:ribose-phosphate diphosphokinase [Conexivisphaerales archaeon]
MDEVYVAGGPASAELAAETARLLRARQIKVEHKIFPDGENYFKLTGDDVAHNVFVFQSTYPPQDQHMMQLLLMSNKLMEDGVKVVAVVPYLAYARQHRTFLLGEVVSLKAIARMMASAGIKRVITMDIHNVEGLGFFDVPAHSLSAVPLLADYLLAHTSMAKPFVLAPDVGASVRAEAMATNLACEFAALEKTRDRVTGETSIKVPAGVDVGGKDVVIVDDMISTGGTIAKAAKMARDSGAKSVLAACTHALLAEGAMEKMREAGIRELIATNTVPSQYSKVSVAPLIADFIKQL